MEKKHPTVGFKALCKSKQEIHKKVSDDIPSNVFAVTFELQEAGISIPAENMGGGGMVQFGEVELTIAGESYAEHFKPGKVYHISVEDYSDYEAKYPGSVVLP